MENANTQQANAWQKVVKTLNEVKPDWFKRGGTGEDLAVAAIRDLATERDEARAKLKAAPLTASMQRNDDNSLTIKVGPIAYSMADLLEDVAQAEHKHPWAEDLHPGKWVVSRRVAYSRNRETLYKGPHVREAIKTAQSAGDCDSVQVVSPTGRIVPRDEWDQSRPFLGMWSPLTAGDFRFVKKVLGDSLTVDPRTGGGWRVRHKSLGLPLAEGDTMAELVEWAERFDGAPKPKHTAVQATEWAVSINDPKGSDTWREVGSGFGDPKADPQKRAAYWTRRGFTAAIHDADGNVVEVHEPPKHEPGVVFVRDAKGDKVVAYMDPRHLRVLKNLLEKRAQYAVTTGNVWEVRTVSTGELVASGKGPQRLSRWAFSQADAPL